MFMRGGSVIVLWSRPKVSHEVLLLLGHDPAPEVSKFCGATGCEWRMVNCEIASQIACRSNKLIQGIQGAKMPHSFLWTLWQGC